MTDEPVGGFRCFGSRGEDRFLVVLEDFEPMRDVLSMVGARFLRDAEIAAWES